MLKANGHIAVWWFFFVCAFFAMFVLACHSGFSEGYYFSMMICMLFVWEKKIKVTSESVGWAEPRGVKGKQKSGGNVERDGDEEEEMRWLRSCWTMEKESKEDWERRWKEVVLFIRLKTSTVAGLFQSRRAQTGLDFMESRPLNSASNIIYKQAL